MKLQSSKLSSCVQYCLIKKSPTTEKCKSVQFAQLANHLADKQSMCQSVSLCTAVHTLQNKSQVFNAEAFKKWGSNRCVCTNHHYKCHYLFSQIYISVSLKLDLSYSYWYTAFYGCNNMILLVLSLKSMPLCPIVWIQNVDLNPFSLAS